MRQSLQITSCSRQMQFQTALSLPSECSWQGHRCEVVCVDMLDPCNGVQLMRLVLYRAFAYISRESVVGSEELRRCTWRRIWSRFKRAVPIAKSNGPIAKRRIIRTANVAGRNELVIRTGEHSV